MVTIQIPLRLLVSMAVLFGLSPLVRAQVADGSLSGRVTDALGLGIPRAQITVTHVDTGLTASATADPSGQYQFNHLAVGRYRLQASADGFQTAARRDLAIELNRAATLNLILEVGPLQLTLEVKDAGVTIDTTSARVVTGFSERQMQQLPVTGLGDLGVLNLSLLSAGVSSSGGVGYGIGPSVGGQRPTNNNFTIDGVDNNDRGVTGPVIRLSNEAVAEFSMQQNQFAPEFGHTSGGQFNLVTKSGTNDLRGSLFLYHQNRHLNALDQAFKRQGYRQAPRFDQNRFGATAGGPIVPNRLFYFGHFEARPLGMASISGGAVFAPTAEGFRRLSLTPGLSRTNLEQLQRFVPTAASAARLLKVAGVDIPVGIVLTEAPSFENYRSWLASADYTHSERDQFRFRYVRQNQNGPVTAVDLPAFITPYDEGAHLATAAHHHLFSPGLINELRLGYQRRVASYPASPLQYPGLDVFPNIGIIDLALELGPMGTLPQAPRVNVFQLMNNLTWVRGRATWKFGYDGRKVISATQFTQFARGYYEYSTLDRFLRDISPEVGERSTGGSDFNGNLLSHYWWANNDWRLRHNLTLNLGLRYEFVGVPAGSRHQQLNAVANVPGLIEFREPRARRADFAPRLGVAWSPGASGRTSVRAGFGMNYDQLYTNLAINTLPPQFYTFASVSGDPTPGFLASGGIPPTARAPELTVEEIRGQTASFVPDQRRPYSLQWNAGVQRVLRHDYTFEARYLGSRGVRLPIQTRLNRMAAITSPERSLPIFFERPSASTLDALALTRDDLIAPRHPLQSAGFTSPLTSFLPIGNSSYHGLATQLNKRFAHGFQITTAYTWSHNIDDSTATLNSTVLSPRRPEDFFNLRRERASSALDHRHRFTHAWYWETPWFRNHPDWWMRLAFAEWTLSGTLMLETGSWATPRSGLDSNLNGDAAGDRTIVNPLGGRKTASAVTPLCRSAVTPIECTQQRPPKKLVGYLVNDPGAQYIQAGEGVFTNAGRNTFRLPMINNWDAALGKRLRLNERKHLELRAEAYNALNHAQFVAGFPSIANGRQRNGFAETAMMQAASPSFGRPDLALQSNARAVQLVARFIF